MSKGVKCSHASSLLPRTIFRNKRLQDGDYCHTKGPKSELEHYHKHLLERQIYNLRLQGASEEDLEKYKEDLSQKLKPLAENEIKLSYILEAVRRKEGIKAEASSNEAVLGFILSQAVYE